MRNRSASSDGKVHVTYGFGNANITQAERQAIINAINQWNAQSERTGVVFDLATGSTPVDLEFAPSDDHNKTGGCAGYGSLTGRVYYSPAWSGRAAESEPGGATVIAHEIGHYLGLGDAGTDPQPPSIMNNPLGGHGTTCQNAIVRTTTVQNTDGTASNDCIMRSRTAGAVPTPTPLPSMCEYPYVYNYNAQACCIDPPPLINCGDVAPQTGCPYEHFLPCGGTPVLIDVNGDGFRMTDAANGVNFDLDGNSDHVRERWSWTVAGTDDAFLVLDRNGNGIVDSGRELFGNFTLQSASPIPNGFVALAEFDKPAKGGNADDEISNEDAIFVSLQLWQDSNHNGISEPGELRPLSSVDIDSILLSFKESKHVDENGNQFRYRAKVRAKDSPVNKWAWDVFLVSP